MGAKHARKIRLLKKALRIFMLLDYGEWQSRVHEEGCPGVMLPRKCDRSDGEECVCDGECPYCRLLVVVRFGGKPKLGRFVALGLVPDAATCEDCKAADAEARLRKSSA